MITRDDTCVSTIESREVRGDLYIMFDIEFPKRLTGGPEKRNELVTALSAK